MKRCFDIIVAVTGLVLASPVVAAVLLAVWLQDFKSPFYIARRLARGARVFRMLKVRTMVAGADKSGVSSTSATDRRITPIGHFVRRYKIDEIVQLWNVLTGDMSLVGPRPQVESELGVYTDEEMKLLSVRPGITDAASIVFSDEGEILRDSADPDLLYNQIIRPWKSRIALLCIQHGSLLTDISLIVLTAVAIVSRDLALSGVVRLLASWGADRQVIATASRITPLQPWPPPGARDIVTVCR